MLGTRADVVALTKDLSVLATWLTVGLTIRRAIRPLRIDRHRNAGKVGAHGAKPPRQAVPCVKILRPADALSTHSRSNGPPLITSIASLPCSYS